VEAKVAAFYQLLTDRNRRLAARSRQIEDAFNAAGPEALVRSYVLQRMRIPTVTWANDG
jgi:hypothetical protein